ncbi:hypothetical protein H8D57_00430, partial [bacterium]|nr:hypothetical protein [bacterium]
MRNVVSNKDPWYIPPEELKKFSRIRNENPRQSRAHDDAHHDRVRDRCKIIAREIIDQEDIKLDL